MEELKKTLEKTEPLEGLRLIIANFAPNSVVFSTSFGQEDQVLTDIIFQNKLAINIFTLDTGRLFQETYELMDKTKNKYKIPFQTYFPAAEQVEELVKEKGFNSFYESIENRKECCAIRKIEPLKRALKDAKVWVTGLRAEQSENRSTIPIFAWDETMNAFKYNPLVSWTYQDVLAYLQNNHVPDNPLHRKGFISIGCQPCTRAIVAGEDFRAGRWWWENSQKECGLHR